MEQTSPESLNHIPLKHCKLVNARRSLQLPREEQKSIMRINNHYKVQKRRSQVIENIEEFGCKNLMPLCPAIRSRDSPWLPTGHQEASPDRTIKRVSQRETGRAALHGHTEQNVFRRSNRKRGWDAAKQVLPSWGAPRSFHDAASCSSCLLMSSTPSITFRYQGSPKTRANTRGKLEMVP